MNNQLPPNPEAPVTEPVAAGPVATAAVRPASAQATWARIGLLGIAAAALIAVAALAIGSATAPSGTLAGSGTDVPTANGATELTGGPGLRGGHGGPGFGGIEITAINGSSVALATEDGWTRTITVDDGTTYTKAGEDIALGDLAVGDTIGFRQSLEDDGTWTIDAIAVILPHVGGEVTAIDGSIVTVELRGGTTEQVNIDGDTNIVVNGDAAELGDIEVGMVLVAEGTENGDGSLDATRVRAGDARLRGDGLGGRGFHGPGFGPGFGPDFAPGFGGGEKPDATTAPEATDSAS